MTIVNRLVTPVGLLALVFVSLSLSNQAVAQSTANRRVEYVYAVNQDSNTISTFRRIGTGLLMPLQTPGLSTGSAPTTVAVNPSGTFAYVANVVSNDLSGYSINPDGSLSSLAASFPAGSGAGWVTIDPTGRFLYVANCAALCSGAGQGNVSGYSINKSTGALVPVPGSPFTAEQIPYAIAIDPTGSFAYVANYSSGSVSVFKIDQTTGSLVSLGQGVPTGGFGSLYLSLDPQGRFLYVVNTQSDNVAAFAIGSNGLLTAVPGSPFPTADFTQGVAVNSSGDFVYISAGFQILGFAIGASGDLTPLPDSPFPAPSFLVSLTTDHSGHFLYGAATSAGVAGYAIDSMTGDLTPVTGSPFSTGGEAFFVTTTAGR
jgi:6-phosphogluconolactonase